MLIFAVFATWLHTTRVLSTPWLAIIKQSLSITIVITYICIKVNLIQYIVSWNEKNSVKPLNVSKIHGFKLILKHMDEGLFIYYCRVRHMVDRLDKISGSMVEGVGRNRLHGRWMDVVSQFLRARGISDEDVSGLSFDQVQWRRIV